jgi:hypothetical protein
MLSLSDKTESFQLNHNPKRSTLSDANKNRKIDFFEDIYNLGLIINIILIDCFSVI